MVIALNRMDEAREKGIFINIRALSEKLGVPVVPTVAHMGKGIRQLVRRRRPGGARTRLPVAAAAEPAPDREPRSASMRSSRAPDVAEAFQVPRSLLLSPTGRERRLLPARTGLPFPGTAARSDGSTSAAEQHAAAPALGRNARRPAPPRRPAASKASAAWPARSTEGWRRWLDELFLHPRWGLLGSLAVFALVLFFVFEVSAVLDSITSARLVAWSQEWQPTSTAGVVGRAVVDGLIGLVGIVVPYMIPLVVLLVALEESGVMHRVAFVVDRGFHHIGLHGGVAVPFLIGLGCNVPAISAAAATASGRDRVIAGLLITFVPCSARSAIILALGGKYLGGFGVFAIFMLTLLVIAVLGTHPRPPLLRRRAGHDPGDPGLRRCRPGSAILRKTWARTSDIVTIVTPLLVVGSVVLALLSHWGADAVINTLLTPITSWWLGLPVVLGVPILFGVLRKELSLLMIYQALGTPGHRAPARPGADRHLPDLPDLLRPLPVDLRRDDAHTRAQGTPSSPSHCQSASPCSPPVRPV